MLSNRLQKFAIQVPPNRHAQIWCQVHTFLKDTCNAYYVPITSKCAL